MAFPIFAESKISAVAQRRIRFHSLIECALVIHQRVFQHLGKALAGENKRSICEELLVNPTVESNHLKQVTVAIAGKSGYTHAGQHLPQSNFESRAERSHAAGCNLARQ